MASSTEVAPIQPTVILARVNQIKLSEVLSALSFALDITEGQPEGHASRSCMIGMRLARQIGLDTQLRPALYYALLLKDLGCSSNAAKVCALFAADDIKVKHGLKTIDWTNFGESLRFASKTAAPKSSALGKSLRIVKLGLIGPSSAKEMFATRCERGANIARLLSLPEETANAIRALDEHWDGLGQPEGLKGEAIPLLGRVLGISQTVEVFFTEFGLAGAMEMAHERREKWFDPALVDALDTIESDTEFWRRLAEPDVLAQVQADEPGGRVLMADDNSLDNVALAFAKVIDAKSPWTYRHSERVSEIAVAIGKELNFSGQEQRDLRRAGLLHDIGKLGISNSILDKPGKLTPEEFGQMKQHPEFTQHILARIGAFQNIVETAASHHEKLDGSGYHRALKGDRLSPAARALCVADVCEALLAERPYRPSLSREAVLDMIRSDAGSKFCSDCVGGLAQCLPVMKLD